MKKILLLFVFIFSQVQAQNLEWEKTDMANALGRATTTDSQGNVITVASGPLNTNSDGIYLRKYAPDGTLLWSTTEPAVQITSSGVLEQSRPVAITTDSQDDIVITGFRFNTNSTSCPLPPCVVPISNKIWKFESSGNLIFNETFDDHGQANDVFTDSNDDIYINGTGLITDTDGDTGFGTILIKVSATGSTVFTDVQDIVGSGNSIDQGVLGFGDNLVTVFNATTFDNKLTAWDQSGNFLWSVDLSSDIDQCKAVVINPATNNTFILSQSFPPNPIITKVDQNGNILFHQSYFFGEQAVPNGLQLLSGNRLAFAATTWSDLGSNSTLYAKVVSTTDGSDVFNASYTLDQNLSRVQDMDHRPNSDSFYIGVNSTTNGGAPASGTLHAYNYLTNDEWHVTYAASNDVRSVAAGTNNAVYLMTQNEWNLAKYNSGLTVGMTERSESSVRVFPNPAEQLLVVQFDHAPFSMISATVYDLLGVRVMSTRMTNERLDISTLPPGIYLLKVDDLKGRQAHAQFVKH